MEPIFCQSCGMPLEKPEDFGTNADQTPNPDYCIYCFKDGDFTQDCTMDEMIDLCTNFLDEYNEGSGQKLNKAEAVAQMKEYFPQLKRWAKQ